MNEPLRMDSILPVSRRDFLRASSLAAGAAAVGFPQLLRAQGANAKLNLATVGAGGKGSSDTDHCASENIVALCDVDRGTLDGRAKKYPQAKLYQDWRKMFEEMGKSIDGVIVSSPDHTHAAAAAAAIKMGKHVYVQKPLVHSVFEARTLRQLAKQHKIVS
jgi:predicted dehydrogenase